MVDLKELKDFKHLNSIRTPKLVEVLPKILKVSFIVIILILVATPWIQTSKGSGYVVAFDPNDRVQSINALTSGRIKKWYVRDSSVVNKGDKIVEIVDNDPQLIERMTMERDAKKRKYDVAKIAAETAKINYDRQNELYKKGLSSRKEYESAKIEYKKLLSATESVASELAISETKLSRQSNQTIYAPKDGIILKILAGDEATLVQSGQEIARFAPDIKEPMVELYVSGNDIPLIHPGRKVRLQFEGWPVIQFSGWPSVAVGTFGGVVSAVDSSISENGKFRVLVKKEEGEKWPDQRFLRHGARAYGWVLLNRVQLGYEIWRQLNGFPPKFDESHQSMIK